MKKICVYTCITGEYDNLASFKKEKNVDYICYTNNKNIKSDIWNIKYISDDKLSNVKLARKIKIMGTPDLKKYDVVVWIDGNASPISSVIEFVNKYDELDKYDLIGFKHHERNTTYEELEKCYECRKESLDNINKLLELYTKEKFKDVIPLIESGVLMRNFNNERLNKAMELWFKMIEDYSHRDQLSFGYAVYKTDLKVKLLDINQYDNEYFECVNHTSEATSINVEYIIGKNNTFDIKSIKAKAFDIKNNKLNIKVPAGSQIKLYFELKDIQVGIIENTSKYNFFNISTNVDGNIIVNNTSFLTADKDVDINIHVYNDINTYLNELNKINGKLAECYSKVNEVEEKYITLQKEHLELLDKYKANIFNKIKDKISK